MNFRYKCDLINGPAKPGTVIFLYQGANSLDNRPELASFRMVVQHILANGSFKGEYLESLPLYYHDEDTWLILIGLGQSSEFSESRLLECGAKAGQTIATLSLKEATIILPPFPRLDLADILELLAIGSHLSLSRRITHKSKEPDPLKLKNLTFQFLSTNDPIDNAKNVLFKAQTIAEAQIQARHLSDLPPDQLYPETFAEEAVQIALKMKLKATVWDESQITSEWAGGLLAVGKGSIHPPRLLILEYHGGAKASQTTALVGKGITFDSGGLCLKPAENMSQMKTDMAGAAAVLSVMGAAAALHIHEHLLAVIPLAENMPGGKAYRPGDIITTLSRQTVEVVNTDAEGRLILADALTVAQKYQPNRLIDIATLTGACSVALGDLCAGLFCNNRELQNSLINAGASMGELFWPLPLLDDYDENLKSDLADFKQAASRSGGAIHAALFLRKFINPELPWAHLDIAGTGRRNLKVPSCPEGGSGFGVRTLLKLLTNV